MSLGGKHVWLGTCFAYHRPDRFITASHCAPQVSGKEMLSVITRVGPGLVYEVKRHPQADIAVLKVEPAGKMGDPFLSIAAGVGLGRDYYAYGFPDDLQGPVTGDRARLFRTYFQRLFVYDVQKPYSYAAAEMNISCPTGLSGGPIFEPIGFDAGEVTGLVTTNVDVAIAHEAFEEVEERYGDGRVKVTEYRRVISYGIALLLKDVKDWIDEYVSD